MNQIEFISGWFTFVFWQGLQQFESLMALTNLAQMNDEVRWEDAVKGACAQACLNSWSILVYLHFLSTIAVTILGTLAVLALETEKTIQLPPCPVSMLFTLIKQCISLPSILQHGFWGEGVHYFWPFVMKCHATVVEMSAPRNSDSDCS